MLILLFHLPPSNWENNIKMDHREIDNLDLREIGWSVMDWIRLAQDSDQWRALVNMVMNL
jgi:hypothetical protein